MQVAYVRAALEEQANAFVELAEKCCTIFSAQRAMIELLPANVDIAFLSQGHSGGLCLKSVNTCTFIKGILIAFLFFF